MEGGVHSIAFGANHQGSLDRPKGGPIGNGRNRIRELFRRPPITASLGRDLPRACQRNRKHDRDLSRPETSQLVSVVHAKETLDPLEFHTWPSAVTLEEVANSGWASDRLGRKTRTQRAPRW
jgi:hypothetical protein